MSKIFIYGVPGAGKTYFAKALSKKVNLPVLEGDLIKTQLRKNKSKTEFPFLYLGTCQAYQQFGELNQTNAIQGLLAVRAALTKAVEKEIENYDSLILEGAFLDPRILMKYGKVILLTTTEEKKHKHQFLSHTEKLLDFRGNEFKAARIIQKYFIDEATELGVEIIENDTDVQENIKTIE